MFKTVSGFVLIAGVLAASATFMDYQTGSGSAAKPASTRVSAPQVSGPAVTALSANAQGHFVASALVNGVHVEMLADTGATAVVLTQDDAERAGFHPGWLEFNVKMQTANGITEAAAVTIDEVEVGRVTVRDVRALVAKPGVLGHSLLGMSFIGALTRFELKGDQLLLVQ